LLAFHPRPGWARRFWFGELIALPRGTILSMRVVKDPPSLLPAGVAAASADAAARVTVNLVP